MNKVELIDRIADQLPGLSKKAIGEVVDGLLEAVTTSLTAGDSVSLPGFGVFKVNDGAARMRRNPRTGESITIPASKAPAFTPGKALSANPAVQQELLHYLDALQAA